MIEKWTHSRTIVVVGLAVIAAAAPLAAQRNRITGRIDGSQTVTLRGHLNPNAQPEFDQGPVDAAFPLNDMALALKPSDAQQADLTALLAAQQDPASPDYHNWLVPEQFAARFGASPSDISQITAWLEAQGFVVRGVAPSRNWIAFSGSAGLARQAFGVEIHRYQVDGESHFANASEPSAPAALAGLVAGIRGLDDFLPRSPRPQLRPEYTSASGHHYLAPDDAATIYNLKSLYQKGYDGSGQKLVVAGQSAIDLSDIQAFRTLFSLPKNDPQIVLVPGSKDPGIVSGDVVEADLDVEWSGAMAKNASLTYVYSRNVFDAVQYAVAQNLAPVVSLSYGTCETGAQSTATLLRLVAQQANAQGITWIASSGDSGAFGCESGTAATAVQGPAATLPASIPEVTAVGGTSFNEGSGTYWSASNNASLGSALSYIPETSWNDTAAANLLEASGGGPSALYAKPSWQTGTGVPNDSARDIPDVAMPAGVYHDGAIVCTSGSCANGLTGATTVVGGTSLSAQLFAGVAVLVNHYQVGSGAAAKAGLANMNPTLYTLATKYGDAFHDVVSGDNIEPCRAGFHGCASGSFGYQAGAGYDLVTGLGSVNAYTLAAEWNLIVPAPVALSSVAVSSANLAGGGSATVTVELTGPAPSGGATVTLLSSSAAVFPAPASILVAAGQTSASVKVQAAQVTASTSVTVTATYNGASKTASLTIAPVVQPSLTAITVTPSSVAGGSSAVLAMTLSGPAPSGGATVSLSSSNAAFPVPASVVVPAGANGAQLSVRTATVTASIPATVTATYNGAGKTAGVTVTPVVLPTLTAVAVTPSSVAGGSSVTLVVTLSGPAPPGGATVTLSSSNAIVFPAPATIVIPPGQASPLATAGSSASVTVRTSQVTASTSITVTAAYNGASKTAGVTVTPIVLPTLTAVAVTPASLTGGSVAVLAITLSGPAPAGGASVSLSSGNAAFPVPASVAIRAGATGADLSVRTATVTASTPVTVTATYNGASKTAAVTVTPVVLPTLTAVAVTPTSVTGGSFATLVVTLGGPAPPGGATVTVSSSNATVFPAPASVLVPAGLAESAIGASVGVKVRTSQVTASTPVTVTATYNGASKTATVTVTPVVLPSLASVNVTPSSVTAGSNATLVVMLSGPAPAGGASVSLASDNAAFPVPASIAVPAGAMGVDLRVQTKAVAASTLVAVTAVYNNATKTAGVTVKPAPLK
jgi:subtilase family serine protease